MQCESPHVVTFVRTQRYDDANDSGQTQYSTVKSPVPLTDAPFAVVRESLAPSKYALPTEGQKGLNEPWYVLPFFVTAYPFAEESTNVLFCPPSVPSPCRRSETLENDGSVGPV